MLKLLHLISEIILSIVWIVLFLSGTAFQFIRERKKAPFPACPAHVKRGRRLDRPQSRTRTPPHEERRPLLGEGTRNGQEGQLSTADGNRRVAPSAPAEHNQPT